VDIVSIKAAVEARIVELNRLINAHAGRIELVELSPEGAVTVRYEGMCAGCELRPLTTVGTVRPGLLAIDGVTRVEVQGSRISEEAEKRIAESLEPYAPGRRLLGLLEARRAHSTPVSQ
jgi:Fe-S cluster biogenesis protein NfuA